MVHNERPDLIIADVLLPDMNGFEMAIKLRESPETKNIPIIFISALAQLGSVAKKGRPGITQFFTKPIDQAHLLENIQKLLSNR